MLDPNSVTKEGQSADFSKAKWFKSNKSAAGECVEVAFVGGLIGVRDSKDAKGTKLVFTKAEWVAFVAGAKGGEFDLTNKGA